MKNKQDQKKKDQESSEDLRPVPSQAEGDEETIDKDLDEKDADRRNKPR